MRLRFPREVRAFALILATMTASTAHAASTVVAGQAAGVRVDALLVDLGPIPFVMLAPTGGPVSASILGVTAAGLVTTGQETVNGRPRAPSRRRGSSG